MARNWIKSSKPKGYAEGGEVSSVAGGKKVSSDEAAAIDREYVAASDKDGGHDVRNALRPGGVRSPYPNLTSDNPETEKHLRFMEAHEASLSATENETDGSSSRGRYTKPEDRARYHGFAKGGEVKHVAKKHKFRKPAPKSAPPVPPEQTATDVAPAAMPAAMPAQGAPMPAQATGGVVDRVASMTRSSRMYGAKKVRKA